MIEPILKLHPIYQNILVSECGTIIQNTITQTIYKQNITSKGYARIEFRWYHNGISKVVKRFIHVLVAETYIIKPRGKHEVDHRDRDRLHNHYLNLRYVTHTQNIKNSSVYKHGKYRKKRRNK